MRPEDILSVLHRKPFLNFKLVMDDGTAFEIRHPDQVLVSRSSLVIGVPERNGDQVYDRFVIAALLHISRIEPERREVA